jgi:hypothetical protein
MVVCLYGCLNSHLHQYETHLNKFYSCLDLREIGWDGMDWIDLAQDGDRWRTLLNTVMNLRVP